MVLGVAASAQAVTAVLIGLIFVGTVGNFSGIGGGGVFMGMFGVGLRLPLDNATALSNVAIFPGSLVMTIFNIPQTVNNDRRTPVINYGLCLATLPMLLLGESGGSVFQVKIPKPYQVISLGVLMFFLTCAAYFSSIRKWRARLKVAQEGAPGGAAIFPGAPLNNNCLPHIPRGIAWACAGLIVAHMGVQLGLAYALVANTWWGVTALECAIMIPTTICVVIWCQRSSADEETSKKSPFYLHPMGKLTFWETVLILVLYGLAGVVTTMLGAGTGTFLGPVFLLMLELDPQVQAPTTTFLVCIASGMGCLQGGIMGILPRDLAVVSGSTSLVGGLLAVLMIWLLRKTGYADLVGSCCMTLMITAAFIMVLSVGFPQAYEDLHTPPSASASFFHPPSPLPPPSS